MEGPPEEESNEGDVESRIETLINEMDSLNEDIWTPEELENFGTLYSRISEDMQLEWYDVEMEALSGADREVGEKKLESFVERLRKEAERLKLGRGES